MSNRRAINQMVQQQQRQQAAPAQPNWWQALIITQVPTLLSTLMGLIGMAIQHGPQDHPAMSSLQTAQTSLAGVSNNLADAKTSLS